MHLKGCVENNYGVHKHRMFEHLLNGLGSANEKIFGTTLKIVQTPVRPDADMCNIQKKEKL